MDKVTGRRILFSLVSFAFLASLLTSCRPSAAQTEMVPVPGGVKLATTVYYPQDDGGPWPAILWRTPYGRTSEPDFIEFGESLAGEGIVTVMQDQRGRYDSEGEYNTFFNDKADGQATLDCITAQHWSNGRVAMEGGSAQGIVQYMLAPGASEALVCQWIEVAEPDLYMNAVYQGGVFRDELVRGWLEDIGSPHLIEVYKSHPLNDGYWDPAQIVDDYADVRIPAFHIGGYFDIFARGIINGFLGYQYQGGEGAAGRQHLIMGPWIHAVNNPQVGEITFPNAVLDELYNEWQALWYEACVFDRADMAELDALPTVTYFRMGAVGEEHAPGNEWQFAETWPPEGFTETQVYLQPDFVLDIQPPDENGSGDTFTFDPNDPSPTICGANLMIDAGSCDQEPVEARKDVVVYTSPVLEEPLEVTGDLSAEIWIMTDVPDTDIAVRLTDVYPDGRSMLVADGIVRARYHNSPEFDSFEFLEPDTPYRLTLDLGPTSMIFNAGHKIRVSVTSSNWPRFSVNPNTGELFLRDGDKGRIAHTTILHDVDYPSAIILPIK